MLLAALALAHVANDYAPPRSTAPQSERIVKASVVILSAEEVSPRQDIRDSRSSRRPVARQRVFRDGMPIIEFY